MFELTPRFGPRPKTTDCAPHEQVSQNPDASTYQKVNAPPAKAGGFGLRLEAGSVRHWADYTTSKSSSGSGGFWFLIYSFHTSSVTFPLVFTQ